jgi:tRNA (guanine-N7-)-methyltransferase
MCMTYHLAHGRERDDAPVLIAQNDLPPFENGRIDPRLWFPDPARPFEIEIGCGKGTFLVQQATERAEVNYLGVEWAKEFAAYAADRIRRRGLAERVRLLHGDATEFLRYWCADAVARVIHLYFSDPWPKSRHHKRRVVQDATLVEFHRVLQERGELRLVTDHAELWAWCREHAARAGHLFEQRPFAPPESAGGGEIVGSNFERKYAREGRPFFAMTLLKKR